MFYCGLLGAEYVSRLNKLRYNRRQKKNKIEEEPFLIFFLARLSLAESQERVKEQELALQCMTQRQSSASRHSLICVFASHFRFSAFFFCAYPIQFFGENIFSIQLYTPQVTKLFCIYSQQDKVYVVFLYFFKNITRCVSPSSFELIGRHLLGMSYRILRKRNLNNWLLSTSGISIRHALTQSLLMNIVEVESFKESFNQHKIGWNVEFAKQNCRTARGRGRTVY